MDGVAMGERGTLRPAGRAACEDDRERVVLGDLCGRCRIARTIGGRGDVERRPGGERLAPTRRGVGDDQRRPRDLERRRELGVAPARVERHDHTAGPDGGDRHEHRLHRCRCAHHDAIAGPHAVIEQVTRDARDGVGEVGELERLVRPGDGRAVTVLRSTGEELDDRRRARPEHLALGAQHRLGRELERAARADDRAPCFLGSRSGSVQRRPRWAARSVLSLMCIPST